LSNLAYRRKPVWDYPGGNNVRALHVPEPRRHFVADVPTPSILDDEVLVEVALCATCTQWDITTWTGVDIFEREGYPKYPLPPGATGHELAGVVVKTGRDVRRLVVGDRVAYWGMPGVGRPPETGGYAEYFAAHECSFVRYPDTMRFERMALTELLTCLASALFKAGEVDGKRVGVSGLGPAGLMAVQALKARGAREVVAFDIAQDRIDLAKQLGADRGMVPGSEEWSEFLPTNRNLDISIDCIGLARSVNDLMRITRDQLIVFGVPHGDILFTMEAWFKDLSIEPCGPRTERGARYAAHLLTSGQVKVDSFIHATLPMERYDEGVGLLMDKRAIKVAFDPRLTG
jgi:threonine dehydrogenase-like Zn-dependent dehydrogenase